MLKKKFNLHLDRRNNAEQIEYETESYHIFEEFLDYEQYPYRKIENPFSQDNIYEIEGKKFICLNLSRFNPEHKINGIGSLIL